MKVQLKGEAQTECVCNVSQSPAAPSLPAGLLEDQGLWPVHQVDVGPSSDGAEDAGEPVLDQGCPDDEPENK